MENAGTLGIDPDKVVIGGISGGGWITCGALVLMAKSNHPCLPRLRGYICNTGMLSGEIGKIPKEQLDEFEDGPLHVCDV